jgi:hypothetical protein
MMADLGLFKIQLGMVLSAFAWGYAFFQFPGGFLKRKEHFNGKKVVAVVCGRNIALELFKRIIA